MAARKLYPADRAGTKLDPDHLRHIYATAHAKKSHGVIDTSQRVYQSGGDDFIMYSRSQVTMAASIWPQIKDDIDRLEFVDRKKNQCYAIPISRAARLIDRHTDAKIGSRVGFPLSAFDVTDKDGALVRASVVR